MKMGLEGECTIRLTPKIREHMGQSSVLLGHGCQGLPVVKRFTPASSTGWCKQQVQTLKAAKSTGYIFSLSYSTGETEAVNIWEHLSEACFLISHFLKRKRKMLQCCVLVTESLSPRFKFKILQVKPVLAFIMKFIISLFPPSH